MKEFIKNRLREELSKKLTCLYIHGLGAEISEDIKEALSDYNLIYPRIDYDNSDNPYYQCLILAKEYNVDFIIGHSVGGVIAYWLAKERNIPALLLCPAFGDEYMVYVTKSIKRKTPKMLAILGTKDDEVNPKKIKSVLENQPDCTIKEFNIGHDISPKNLAIITKAFTSKL